MTKDMIVFELNSRFSMIGLSADWIYRTWLIEGCISQGIVIFENEDNSVYEIIRFYHSDDDDRREDFLLYSGSLIDVVSFHTSNK